METMGVVTENELWLMIGVGFALGVLVGWLLRQLAREGNEPRMPW